MRMKRWIGRGRGPIVAATLLLASGGAVVAPMRSAAAESTQVHAGLPAELASVLQDSAAAWSRGDLDGFMHCYEDDAATTYVNGSGLVGGYHAIRAMYAARFTGGAGVMGRLSTQLMSARPLGPDYAIAYGRYRLERPTGHTTGLFSLVFHRASGAWKIVSDHTS